MEFHFGELFPRVGFIVTNLSAPNHAVVRFYNKRGMAEQWWNDEDMGHGFAVPLVVLWIIWRERGRWQSLPSKPSACSSGVS